MGSWCGGVDPDLVTLRAEVDARTRRLPPAERIWVRDAIANSTLEGYRPDLDGIERLVALAAGELSMAQYRREVLASVGLRHEPGEPS
ncbi:hypothetical protein ACK280_25315 [Mycobacterium sherrisii]|uniref:antitoxin VbhA family protein n=1 Tax=Mycobacterium sherrisii TaxID=243061 RepID=UPI003974F6B3